MTLDDIYEKPMKEILSECNITMQKVNTNDFGEVCSIEMKYVPKNAVSTSSNKTEHLYR